MLECVLLCDARMICVCCVILECMLLCNVIMMCDGV